MADVVGTAYVRIRGVTTQLGSDMQDAVDDGASKMDMSAFQDRFKDSARGGVSDGVRDADLTPDTEGFKDHLSKETEYGVSQGARRADLTPASDGWGDHLARETSWGISTGSRGSTIDFDRDHFKNALMSTTASGLRKGALQADLTPSFTTWGKLLKRYVSNAFGDGFQDLSFSSFYDRIKNGLKSASGGGLTEGFKKFNLSNFFTRMGMSMDRGFTKIFKGESWTKLVGRIVGSRFADRFIGGFTKRTDQDKKMFQSVSKALDKFKDAIPTPPPIAWLAVLAVPLLGGAIKLVSAYIATLIAQLGYLLTALAGVGVAAVGMGAALVLGLIPILLAFKAETPAMDEFKESISLQTDEWLKLGAAVQEYLLPALDSAYTTLGRLIPVFTPFSVNMGRIVGNMAKLSAEALTSEKNLKAWEVVLKSSETVMGHISDIVVGLAGILPRFLAEIAPLTERLAASLSTGFGNFFEMLDAGIESGSLITTLETWYERAELVGEALRDMVNALWNIFEIGAEVVTPMFENLAGFAERWLAWTESTEGENKIAQYFEKAMEVAQAFNELIKKIWDAIMEPVFEGDTDSLISVLQWLGDDLLPQLVILGQSLSEELGTKMMDLADSFLILLTSLNDTGALGKTVDVFGAFFDVLNKLLNIPGFGSFLGNLLGFLMMFKALNFVLAGLPLLAVKHGLTGLFAALGGFAGIWSSLGTAWTAVGLAGLKVVSVVTAIGKVLALIFSGSVLVVGIKIVAIILAIIAVVMAVIWAFKNWDKIKEFIGKVYDWIKDMIPKIGTFLKELPGKIAGWMKDAGLAFLDWTAGLRDKIGEKIGEVWNSVWESVTTFIGNIPGWIAGAALAFLEWTYDLHIMAGEKLAEFAVAVWDWVTEFIGEIPNHFAGAALAFLDWTADIRDSVAERFAEVAEAVWTWIVGFVGEIPGKIAGAATAVWEWVTEAAGMSTSELGKFATSVWNWAKTFMRELPGKFISFIGSWASFGSSLMSAIVSGLQGAVGSVMSWGGNLISAIQQGIYNAAPSWLRGALGWLVGEGSRGITMAAAGFMKITDHLKAMANAVSSGVGSVVSGIGSAIGLNRSMIQGPTGFSGLGRNAVGEFAGIGGGASGMFSGGIPRAGSGGLNLIVKIGDTDITDIVDARVSEDNADMARALFVRRH